MNHTGAWTKFKGRTTPSSVELDQLFFENIPLENRILDFGCGWGRIAYLLMDVGYQVEGFDINPAAVKEANKNVDKPQFKVANALNLPYSDSMFDTCLLNAFLTTITRADRPRVIQEAHRVLKDNGSLYLADFERDRNNPLYKQRYEDDYSQTRERGTFIVTRDGTTDAEAIYWAHHFTLQELENILEPYFNMELVHHTNFTSYHGNPAKGIIIMAKKKELLI